MMRSETQRDSAACQLLLTPVSRNYDCQEAERNIYIKGRYMSLGRKVLLLRSRSIRDEEQNYLLWQWAQLLHEPSH